jgi:hypothetical protein
MNTGLHRKRAIGTFSNHTDAEAALLELRDSGFPMDMVSVVGQDANHMTNLGGAHSTENIADLATDNKAGAGVRSGAATGGTVGGVTGLLVGLGMVAIPGLGPIMMAGAGATALATALTGGAIGAATGGIAGGLVGLGIPENRATGYGDRLDRGDYLVMIDGSDAEVQRAQTILSHRGISDWGIYDQSASQSANRI